MPGYIQTQGIDKQRFNSTNSFTLCASTTYSTLPRLLADAQFRPPPQHTLATPSSISPHSAPISMYTWILFSSLLSTIYSKLILDRNTIFFALSSCSFHPFDYFCDDLNHLLFNSMGTNAFPNVFHWHLSRKTLAGLAVKCMPALFRAIMAVFLRTL